MFSIFNCSSIKMSVPAKTTQLLLGLIRMPLNRQQIRTNSYISVNNEPKKIQFATRDVSLKRKQNSMENPFNKLTFSV